MHSDGERILKNLALIAAFAALSLTVGAQAEDVQVKGKPYYCFGYNNNKNLYFSDTFEVPPNTPANPLVIGFGQFLTEKYGLSFRTGWAGGIHCSWDDKAKFVPEPGMAGYKIIETGWKPKSLPPPYAGP